MSTTPLVRTVQRPASSGRWRTSGVHRRPLTTRNRARAWRVVAGRRGE